MRLFLSSQDLGDYADKLVELVGSNKKVWFINNAKDDLPKEEIQASTADKKAMFESLGFEFEALDLRDYFGKPDLLKEKLRGVGLVWTSGGNTFILRRAMAASGLDKILQELVPAGKLTYGGSSAGSCVVAPSLRGIDNGDRPQPNVVPAEYPIKATIWEGLNLVSFMVVPHCGSDWFAEKAEATIQYLERHNLPYQALSDGQVIVVNGEKMEFLK